MFSSLEFGLIREKGSRAYIDGENEDLPNEPPKDFVDSLTSQEKSSVKVLLLATTPLAKAFVSTCLDFSDESIAGQISLKGDGNPTVAKYFKHGNDVMSCQLIMEHLISINDANNFAQTLCDGFDCKIQILHSLQIGTCTPESVRFLKTCKSSVPSKLLLERPSIISGVPAAVLTLAELRKIEAVIMCSFVYSLDIDSISLEGFCRGFKELKSEELKMASQDVIKSKLKELNKKSKPGLLYI